MGYRGPCSTRAVPARPSVRAAHLRRTRAVRARDGCSRTAGRSRGARGCGSGKPHCDRPRALESNQRRAPMQSSGCQPGKYSAARSRHCSEVSASVAGGNSMVNPTTAAVARTEGVRIQRQRIIVHTSAKTNTLAKRLRGTDPRPCGYWLGQPQAGDGSRPPGG